MSKLSVFIMTLFLNFFTGSLDAHASIDENPSRVDQFPFVSSYQQWIDPQNHFIDYFNDQARVIFIGSSAYSEDGNGIRPSVSEGMGYGLLLSYANDDQATFDKFLRYVLSISNSSGCSLFDGKNCLAPAFFMMPWIVNESGSPFWYLSSPGTTAYYSSGSAMDADIQIAWAIYLASLKVSQEKWANNQFATVTGPLSYLQIFQQMAFEIRLNDVDLWTLRYIPGNQWGAAGTQVLYPGYFTPQAFLALDTVPPPNVSSDCPTNFPQHSPINSLLLVFKNNVTKTISIDYMGGNGTVTVDENFIPKPGVPNGYTVPAVTTATATFSSPNQYYANATIQATFYDEHGVATMKSDYYMEYNNNVWTVTDKGSTQQSKYCQSPAGNVVNVILTGPDIDKVTYPFSDVMTNSFKSIQNFQTSHSTGLIPNVIHFNGQYPDQWSESFAYDACRFPLWSSHFVQTDPTNPNSPAIKDSVDALLGSKGVQPFVQQGTLPTGGIDAITQKAVGDWSILSPALNAPVLAAAYILGNQQLYNDLSPGVFQYDITKNQPSPTDPQGDSTPYYNAVLVLLTRAIMENRL